MFIKFTHVDKISTVSIRSFIRLDFQFCFFFFQFVNQYYHNERACDYLYNALNGLDRIIQIIAFNRVILFKM